MRVKGLEEIRRVNKGGRPKGSGNGSMPRITLSLSPELLALVEHAAICRDQHRADWLRQAIEKAASRDVARNEANLKAVD